MIKNQEPKFIKHKQWKKVCLLVTGFSYTYDKRINLIGCWINLLESSYKRSKETSLTYTQIELMTNFEQYTGKESHLSIKSTWNQFIMSRLLFVSQTEQYTDDSGVHWIYDGFEWKVDLSPNDSKQIFRLQDECCECGLRFVRDGGLHSSWCPMKKHEKSIQKVNNE